MSTTEKDWTWKIKRQWKLLKVRWEICSEVKSMLAELSKANEELTEEDKLFREKLISLIQ